MASTILWVVVSWFILRLMTSSRAQTVPSLFVFGDSLVDVGNNNYMCHTVIKANFPHNGIDFPTHKATGRFCNGKNPADFLAEKLGLPSPPAYLSLVHKNSTNFLTGVSFASGGAAIFDGTSELFGSIDMNKQIEYYTTVQKSIVQQVGQEAADEILSKSIITIVIGSNDVLSFRSSSSSQMNEDTPQQYVDSMLLSLKDQLKRIYDLGGRKFVMIGLGPIGCCPTQRNKNKTEGCYEESNLLASKFNQGLLPLLQQCQTELNDFRYTYFDTYTVLLNLIQHPTLYGFKEVKGACCGLGSLNARVPCLPTSIYCSNRSDHVFWDFFHPTEAVARIIVETAFDGPTQYAFPLTLRELASHSHMYNSVLATSIFS